MFTPQLLIKSAIGVSLFLTVICYSVTSAAQPVIGSGQAMSVLDTEISSDPQLSFNCPISSNYGENIQKWCQLISLYAEQHGLPPNLIAAVILQESGGDPLAYSASGAVGLMQVMPRDGLASAFMCINGPCFASRPTINELQDPEFNVDYGTRFLASLVNKYGDFRNALKAYGPANVDYYYADKVMAIYEGYK